MSAHIRCMNLIHAIWSILDTILTLVIFFGKGTPWMIPISITATHVCLALDTGPTPNLVQSLRFYYWLCRHRLLPLCGWAYSQTEETLAVAARILGVMYPVMSWAWSSTIR